MEAEAYSGNGMVYSKKIKLSEVAWVSNYEGQYANVPQAEEATTRLDNLRVAKEMEAVKVEKQYVDIRNSFNYRGTTINQIENTFWTPFHNTLSPSSNSPCSAITKSDVVYNLIVFLLLS